MRTRFDYVSYNENSQALQMSLKSQFNCIELMLNNLPNSREKSLVLTKLEEAYMWCGKAIRDEQLRQTPETEMQEQRVDS